jgi:uncharacterized membrane protein
MTDFQSLSMRRRIARIAIGVLFLGAGIVHFTHASAFESLVPAALKDFRGSINAATGALIFAIGIAFLTPRLHVVARWSAIPLLAATLPVTVYRAFDPAPIATLGFPPAFAIAGVIAWLLMIALIWWATKPETEAAR